MYIAINIEDWNLYFMSGLIALNPKTFPIYLFISLGLLHLVTKDNGTPPYAINSFLYDLSHIVGKQL